LVPDKNAFNSATEQAASSRRTNQCHDVDRFIISILTLYSQNKFLNHQGLHIHTVKFLTRPRNHYRDMFFTSKLVDEPGGARSIWHKLAQQ
jgi:hypothetical protein